MSKGKPARVVIINEHYPSNEISRKTPLQDENEKEKRTSFGVLAGIAGSFIIQRGSTLFVHYPEKVQKNKQTKWEL